MYISSFFYLIIMNNNINIYTVTQLNNHSKSLIENSFIQDVGFDHIKDC